MSGDQPRQISTAQAIVLGGLVVGALDLTDAIVFFGIRNHVAPVRILYSIASGLIGPAARGGGWAVGLLGLAMHFSIATTIVSVYVIASRWMKSLTRHTVACGIVYGAGAWVVMNFVVLPFTQAPPGWPMRTPVVINGMLIHMFGVGLPAAIAARLQAPRS